MYHSQEERIIKALMIAAKAIICRDEDAITAYMHENFPEAKKVQELQKPTANKGKARPTVEGQNDMNDDSDRRTNDTVGGYPESAPSKQPPDHTTPVGYRHWK